MGTTPSQPQQTIRYGFGTWRVAAWCALSQPIRTWSVPYPLPRTDAAPFRPQLIIPYGYGTSKAESVSLFLPVRVLFRAALLRPTGERLSRERNRAEGTFCGWKV